MRLVDTILRRGHLSEQALAEICMTGERPVHLDQCDICAERAVELGRWLDDVRKMSIEDADVAFPPERLAAQQSQILRRLEHLDRPARVIAFPGQSHLVADGHPAGIRPAWVGIAAAAGLFLGVVGGHFTARLMPQQAAAPSTLQAPRGVETASTEALLMPFDGREFDQPRVSAFDAIEQLTPRQSPVMETNALRTGLVP